FEFPYGFGGAPTYFGLITTRHMHEHGTTLEQWAQVAVSTRKWAALNPKARNRDPLTVKDVLDSRPVVWPFNILNICLVTAAGGKLPINTNGGGLSYTHSGMYGIFPIIEATRQLRGECGARQVPNTKLSLVNGMGGMLSAAGTLVLANDR